MSAKSPLQPPTTISALPLRLPPGPPGFPLLGDLRMFDDKAIEYIISLIKQYGNFFTIAFGPRKLVYMVGPRYNQYILVDNVSNFLNSTVGDLMGGPIYGDGVLFLDAAPHKQARRMMQPAFHKKRVETYLETMVDQTEKMIAGWSGEVDISRVMHQLTLNIVARVLFDLDLDTQTPQLSHAWESIMSHNGDMIGVILSRIPFSDRRRGTAIMDALIADLIADRRAHPRDDGDVISSLIAARDEDGTAFDDKQIRDHLFILLLAGHETSANGLTWAFYLLAQHPQWASRLLDEIQTTLGGRVPTMADFDQMPVLDMIIKETLRILPPVAGFLREVANDFELDGYHIPAGTLAFYSIYGTHTMADLYPEPLCFRPERFAPDAPRKYSPYEYLPFGAGSRLCLGQPMALLEIKAILVLTLQKYRLALVPDQNVNVIFQGTLTTNVGIRMIAHPQDGQMALSPAAMHGSLAEMVKIPATTPV